MCSIAAVNPGDLPYSQEAHFGLVANSDDAAQPKFKPTGETVMASITAIANDFFAACETGKGWEACKVYCSPNATFAVQAEPLADIKTLAEYTDWMKGLMTILPDGSYEVKSFSADVERNNVA